ncbi:MAG: hypothetical protein KKC84_04275, partial [Candidatus Omnitrophica bacterium]|nr:hypothetical protein [Candidatus Omnitrophota bacterium]
MIDDQAAILTNHRIHNLQSYFTHSFRIHLGVLWDSTRVIIWALAGANPFWYHFLNVCVHLLCVISLFMLTHRIFDDRALAFLSAFIFAVHPIHTEAVSWISGGHYAFSGLFFIVTFVLFLRWQESSASWVPAVLCFVIGLFAGHAVVMLPLMIIGFNFFLR